jgi:hypothetical protein
MLYPFQVATLGGALRPRLLVTPLTLAVSNTTGSTVLCTITGSVQVLSLWGAVTTVLSANVTAAHLRTNDQSATVDVTLNTGVTLSAAPVGSIISRTGLVATALTLKSNAAGAFQDATTAGNDVYTPFNLTKKTGAVTTLDFRYTTTDAPSSGVITWYLTWVPLSADGSIA